MKRNEWIIVIALIIIVAVIASLVTVNLTGNAVVINGKKLYTTSEIDAKFKSISSSQNMKCSIYGGAMINQNKTGYQNCLEKGYSKLCLMNRITVTTHYSGLNCNSGLQYEDTSTGVVTCDNAPIVNYNYCQSPMEVLSGISQKSMNTNARDELICCK